MTVTAAARSRPPALDASASTASVIGLLGVLRRRLGMDTAWLGRVDGDRLTIQVLAGTGSSFHLVRGQTMPLRGSLYDRVLHDEMPVLVADTRADRRTSTSRVVRELDIGSLAAAPVVDDTGHVYGVLGCLAHGARPLLRDRDAQYLGMIAATLRGPLTDLRQTWAGRARVWSNVSRVLDRGGPELAFQPVFDLRRNRIVGVEALARFPGGPDPASWFAAAATVGLGVELELAAIRGALAALPRLPTRIGLAVNASAATVSAGLIELVRHCDAERLVVEITEHERIENTPVVVEDLTRLRRLGIRFAADDVGAGYAGLEQLVRLRPEIIKMDCALTRAIDVDPARRAVAAGLAHVAEEIGGSVIAEGIETTGELRAVRGTGIRFGQGFLLGFPARALSDAVRDADD
ncbi:sensor domain-containing phosphodiesterase [Frankia sp. AgKG'84/4]|uniref:sensor domain-containing phosphodiesterase n=1 Tax=Frankia sp. AgKG'84/4 TaxID=573490 RepID=UPI00200E2D7E|nr:EAL domain-containing protein [Frankia sp. AgKG'84/4]MCL9797751.1 EAL domain-containing protein [Frankia sp. AgKG'84/4]